MNVFSTFNMIIDFFSPVSCGSRDFISRVLHALSPLLNGDKTSRTNQLLILSTPEFSVNTEISKLDENRRLYVWGSPCCLAHRRQVSDFTITHLAS
jgi:hypothetical protein